jgi:hypothetical protein
MDAPTYIIFAALLIVFGAAILLRNIDVQGTRANAGLFLITSLIWLIITLCGEFLYTWAGNVMCSTYLGCVNGFLGYDAYEHFLFGIAAAFALISISDRYPRYSVLNEEWWKTALMIIAIIALISVIWEMIECAHDALRLDIFHEPLRNIRLRINLLDQPSNIDTMGDLTMSLAGGLAGVFLIKKGE